MASRIMHLAIASEIAKKINIDDMNRFRIGIILPDAYSPGVNTAISHLKTKICDGTKLTYKLSYFREKYSGKLMEDSLYLGYYMHLIQDIFYRQFVYGEYKWDPTPDGNVEKLHNDYKLLNTYVIEKYLLKNNLSIPIDIEEEALFDIYPFDLKQLMSDFENDFKPYKEGKEFFFTTDMVDEYIKKAASGCIEEIKALRNGEYSIDENKYAWKAHNI